jgi:hypothetical protein
MGTPSVHPDANEAEVPVTARTDIPDTALFVEILTNLRYPEWPADIERARLWCMLHLIVPQRFFVHGQATAISTPRARASFQIIW